MRSIVIVSMLIFSIFAYCEEKGSGRVGNGIDGVVVDGKFKVKDYSHIIKPIINKVFLDTIPGLRGLIHELTLVDPAFGLEILRDLLEVRLWKTDRKLLVTHTAENELSIIFDPSEELIQNKENTVRAAVRLKSSDIIISAPFFEMSEKLDVILHESLHRFMSVPKAFEEINIGVVIEYLKNNKGWLSFDGVSDIFNRYGVNILSFNGEWNSFAYEGIKALFNESIDLETRYNLLQILMMHRHRGTTVMRYLKIIKVWLFANTSAFSSNPFKLFYTYERELRSFESIF